MTASAPTTRAPKLRADALVITAVVAIGMVGVSLSLSSEAGSADTLSTPITGTVAAQPAAR